VTIQNTILNDNAMTLNQCTVVWIKWKIWKSENIDSIEESAN